MTLEQLIAEKGMTKYRVSQKGNIPYATLNDLCSGKTRIEKCSADTLYKLAGVLNQEMGQLYIMIQTAQRHALEEQKRQEAMEYGLPEYLQHDLDAYKEGMKNGSSLMDCLWGELYGSINVAQIDDGAITAEHADYLRQKYLWR